ncbi:hypothetical protein [Flavimaricola marinus]|uniref:Lipoprotein n=1 Tax=Flavimaricola marinus TaxID=1819565 RepID=A0A238LAU2_9RHOB|nr:hypothetical protein [Flavimaricola marinus]SMY06544.1 hypothetical protein LOM8899_00671 [Flavimaricola marinus]
MPRLLPLLLLPILAACDPATMASIPGFEPPPPPPPPTLPAAVAAVLPPGTPVNTVFQDGNGCYLFSIELTDPPSGFPVRDDAGNQICEAQA